MNIDTLKSNNDNFGILADARQAQETAQRRCWRILNEVNQVVNLGFADVIEVHAENDGAHIAMLARQFPALAFESKKATNCANAMRVLWLVDQCEFTQAQYSNCDIVVVTHEPHQAGEVIAAFPNYARIAAKRNIGDNCALSIFGKGLMRDIFKPKVRGEIAA